MESEEKSVFYSQVCEFHLENTPFRELKNLKKSTNSVHSSDQSFAKYTSVN